MSKIPREAESANVRELFFQTIDGGPGAIGAAIVDD
jgi:hypothetical protein